MGIYQCFWHICLRLSDKYCRKKLQSQRKTTNYLQLSTFNHNLRFLCKKTGLSQQKLAEILGVKRGKVAGYFYETQAKPGFHQKLIDHFHIDLGKFLTVEMNQINYDTFFEEVGRSISKVKEPKGVYQKKQDVIDLLLRAKNAENKKERDQLIEEAMGAFGKVISENSELKDKLVEALSQK